MGWLITFRAFPLLIKHSWQWLLPPEMIGWWNAMVKYSAQRRCTLKTGSWWSLQFLSWTSQPLLPAGLWGKGTTEGWGGSPPLTPSGAFCLMVSNNFHFITHFFVMFLTDLTKMSRNITYFGWPEQHAFLSCSHSVGPNWTPSPNRMSISGPEKAPERLNCLPHQVVHLLGRDPSVLESWPAKSTQAALGESRRKWGLWFSC